MIFFGVGLRTVKLVQPLVAGRLSPSKMRSRLDGRMSQTATISLNSGLWSPTSTPPSSPQPMRAVWTALFPFQDVVAEVDRGGDRDDGPGGEAGLEEVAAIGLLGIRRPAGAMRVHLAAAGQVARCLFEVRLTGRFLLGREIESHESQLQ